MKVVKLKGGAAYAAVAITPPSLIYSKARGR